MPTAASRSRWSGNVPGRRRKTQDSRPFSLRNDAPGRLELAIVPVFRQAGAAATWMNEERLGHFAGDEHSHPSVVPEIDADLGDEWFGAEPDVARSNPRAQQPSRRGLDPRPHDRF